MGGFFFSVERKAGSEARALLEKPNHFTSERPLGLAQSRKVWTVLQIPQGSKSDGPRV